MEQKAISIRPFMGARDFEHSRCFYRDLGFEQSILSPTVVSHLFCRLWY